MKQNTQTTRFAGRRGVSLLEVMFAIMIVSVGLILIASLIPLASRQAADSYAMSRGTLMSSNAKSIALAQRLQNPSKNNWLVPDDVSSGSFLAFDGNGDVAPWNTLRDLDNNAALPYLNKTTSFCIDPMFWAAQPNASRGAVPLCDGSEGAYRRTKFPYYREDYDPTTSPDATMSAPSTTFVNPRMLRVTVGSSIAASVPMSLRLAESQMSSRDDLVRTLVDSRNEDASKIFVRGSSANRVASSNEFSWMITLTPNERRSSVRISDFYTMATIVFRNRDRSFQAGKLTTSGIVYDPTSPPDAERVALVTATSKATVGGGGFAVRITSNTAVSDRLRAGDWMMLSRKLPNDRSVFRWYRVSSTKDPVISGNTWSRDVHLAGSDWVFDNNFPTIATLVANVVTVIERTVPVNAED